MNGIDWNKPIKLVSGGSVILLYVRKNLDNSFCGTHPYVVGESKKEAGWCVDAYGCASAGKNFDIENKVNK